MGKRIPRFNSEAICILKENPYTLTVTENRLSITLEAKKKIVEMDKAGMSCRRIIEELGYDPKMLGDQRVRNILRLTRAEAKSELGLRERYAKRDKLRLGKEEIEQLDHSNLSYAQLKSEVIYLREEVEFLKKISQRVISEKQGK